MPRKGITVVEQRKDWDCGIASMAMLLPLSYADVSAVVRNRFDAKRLRKYGLVLYEMIELAELLGYKLKKVYKGNGYLEGKTGILGMNGGKMASVGHWVILKDGTHIVDPDGGEIWSIGDYTVKYKCRPATLLVLES